VSDLLAPVLSDQWGQDKSWKLSRYDAAGAHPAPRLPRLNYLAHGGGALLCGS